jgi:predicted flap endonuclease-1-like 5' DNA nuclease
MSLFSHQPPPTSLPEKSKMSAEERRARRADRLTTIRLRMAIGRELDERGITTPAAIGEALGMPAAEATKLLRGHQWREGDVARLQAAAARLGVQTPSP